MTELFNLNFKIEFENVLFLIAIKDSRGVTFIPVLNIFIFYSIIESSGNK